MFKKKFIITGICIFLSSPLASQSAAENFFFNNINKYSRLYNNDKLVKSAKKFFKIYPHSKYIPNIRFMMAESERNPRIAIKKYVLLLNKFRYFNNNDLVTVKICEILLLQSKWEKLKYYSRMGAKKYSKSRYLSDYKYFYIISLINLKYYDLAEKECLSQINKERNYSNLSRILNLLVFIIKEKTGFSSRYIERLKELLIGFNKSNYYPSSIYLIGIFYSVKKEYNRSYSAMVDIINKFPKSFESIIAEKRLKKLNIYKPVKVEYIPDDKLINGTEKFSIKPYINLKENENSNKSYFSISIGPFYSLKRSREIGKITKQYGKTVIIRMRNGYSLYVGKLSNTGKALRMKIRLAEECGINGRIIRISDIKKKIYIYGD